MGDKEKTIVKQALSNRQPIPERIRNAPRLAPGLELYHIAFLHLDTERQMGPQLPCPIPHSAMIQYAERLGMTNLEADYFAEVIRKVDDDHLARMSKKLIDGQPKGNRKVTTWGRGSR